MRRQVTHGQRIAGPTHARLARELDDVRAALRWCLEHGAAERALTFAVGPLSAVWGLGGHYAEACRWLSELLEAGAALPAWLRAAGHLCLGLSAQYMGDYGELLGGHRDERRAVARGRRDIAAGKLSVLGTARWLDGDDAGAAEAIRESLAAGRGREDAPAIAQALRDLSHVARTQGDYPTARAHLERSVETARVLLERSVETGRGGATHDPYQYLQYLRAVALLGRSRLPGGPRGGGDRPAARDPRRPGPGAGGPDRPGLPGVAGAAPERGWAPARRRRACSAPPRGPARDAPPALPPRRPCI